LCDVHKWLKYNFSVVILHYLVHTVYKHPWYIFHGIFWKVLRCLISTSIQSVVCVYVTYQRILKIMYLKCWNTNFCLQVDELTDNKCHVISFVRFINEGEMRIFYTARSCQKQQKVKTFSTPCPFILKGEDYHGNVALEFAQMAPLPWLVK
jgi:hypothetical protein